ncbi:MAG: biopolymer transporter ExbD [Betaproteobacteria bacterium]|nr:biopolymer transporter ExbD [Betaproteobacteria bacterium]
MAFGGFNQEGEAPLMSEINTTPLVDVMLVLLIIFMVTAPLFTHAVKIDLPQAQSQVNPEKPDTVNLAIDERGRVFWNNEPVADAALPAHLAQAAQKTPQPELHLRADRNTRYQRIAEVMAAAQNAGIAKLGFVTLPDTR